MSIEAIVEQRGVHCQKSNVQNWNRNYRRASQTKSKWNYSPPVTR